MADLMITSVVKAQERIRLKRLKKNVKERATILADGRVLLERLETSVKLNDEMLTAASTGDTDSVKTLLDVGASVNTPDKLGFSAFMYACGNGHIKVTNLIIDDTDVNYGHGTTLSPLLLATKNRHLDIIKVLLAHGADVEGTNEIGRTPLLLACENGSYEIAVALIENGANVNASDNRGNIGLHICASGNFHEIARLLLEHGSHLTVSNHNSLMPFAIASAKRHEQTLNVFHEHRKMSVSRGSVNILV
mmetsp:Transcript_56010/g.67235  ORF Transcript_56010/g.67235 Transcript_56010/m.67235 type:complete len:249 (+) Transcript_56010:281-1027(+)